MTDGLTEGWNEGQPKSNIAPIFSKQAIKRVFKSPKITKEYVQLHSIRQKNTYNYTECKE